MPVGAIPPSENRDELEEISIIAIEKAMTVIRETVQKVKPTIKNISNEGGRPDHVEVNFGVRCDTEKGVVISKGLNESTFNIKLSWNDLGK